jgi:hypothetical protein
VGGCPVTREDRQLLRVWAERDCAPGEDVIECLDALVEAEQRAEAAEAAFGAMARRAVAAEEALEELRAEVGRSLAAARNAAPHHNGRPCTSGLDHA